jgi:hypothetical protein
MLDQPPQQVERAAVQGDRLPRPQELALGGTDFQETESKGLRHGAARKWLTVGSGRAV